MMLILLSDTLPIVKVFHKIFPKIPMFEVAPGFLSVMRDWVLAAKEIWQGYLWIQPVLLGYDLEASTLKISFLAHKTVGK